jgi:glycine oxidase
VLERAIPGAEASSAAGGILAPQMETWVGLRPYTDDHLPILGAGPLPGLFLATGPFRNGILLAPITARLMAQAVLGEIPSLDLTPFRFDRFPRR